MKIEFKKGDQITEDLLALCDTLGKSPTATIYKLVREYKETLKHTQAQNKDATNNDRKETNKESFTRG